jgi:lipopolysaccharide biosynthesis glycosyltransferase
MKDLVYYTVGYNNSYIDVVVLSIKTLRIFNQTVDILLLCDQSMRNECEEKLKDLRVFLYTFPDSPTPEASSIQKLSIFQYPRISEYDRALFIDGDTVIHLDVSVIIERVVNPAVLYVGTENEKMESHIGFYHSLANYTSEQLNFLKDNRIYGFNAGCFAFCVTDVMRTHFRNIQYMIATYMGGVFYEQSFMNVYFNINNMTDRTVLTADTYQIFPNNERYGGRIVHFTGGPGKAIVKITSMKEYINNFMATLLSV